MEKFQLPLGKVIAFHDAISALRSEDNVLDIDLAMDVRKARKAVDEDVTAFREESQKAVDKVIDEIKDEEGRYHRLLAEKKINEELGGVLDRVIEFECNKIDLDRVLGNQKGRVGLSEKHLDALLESGVFFEREVEKPKKSPSK